MPKVDTEVTANIGFGFTKRIWHAGLEYELYLKSIEKDIYIFEMYDCLDEPRKTAPGITSDEFIGTYIVEKNKLPLSVWNLNRIFV